uniref:HP domain-containing protein n=1 Tax=Globodera pallida TaxID=36090 RepID=A0A183CBK1_GLOPA
MLLEQLKIQPKAKQPQPKPRGRHPFHVTDDVQVDLLNEEDDDLTMSRKMRNEMIGSEEKHYRPDIFY